MISCSILTCSNLTATTGKLAEGASVGTAVGENDGFELGDCVGSAVGIDVGVAVGIAVGSDVGIIVGSAVGIAVGSAVGIDVGVAVGIAVGTAVGTDVGSAVGIAVVWCTEGGCVGGEDERVESRAYAEHFGVGKSTRRRARIGDDNGVDSHRRHAPEMVIAAVGRAGIGAHAHSV